jgi:branched-chain amino acid transport system substrate-binding protein
MKMAASFKKFRVRGLLPGIYANTGPNDFYPVEQMQMMRFDGKGNIRFGPLISAETSSE